MSPRHLIVSAVHRRVLTESHAIRLMSCLRSGAPVVRRISLCFTANPLPHPDGLRHVSPLAHSLHVAAEPCAFPAAALPDEHRVIHALRLTVPHSPGEGGKRPATSLQVVLTGRVWLLQSTASLLGHEEGYFAVHLVLPAEVVADTHAEYVKDSSEGGKDAKEEGGVRGVLVSGDTALLTVWESVHSSWSSLFIRNEFAVSVACSAVTEA